jgi:hypothetical protein
MMKNVYRPHLVWEKGKKKKKLHFKENSNVWFSNVAVSEKFLNIAYYYNLKETACIILKLLVPCSALA